MIPSSTFSRSIIAISLTAVIIVSSSFCAKEKELPPPENYKLFTEVSAELLCEKMLVCYEKLYRTVSPALRKELTVDSCKKTALKDLDKKLALHTPRMKFLSVSCYKAILKTPCNQFAAISVFDPTCSALRKESADAFANF